VFGAVPLEAAHVREIKNAGFRHAELYGVPPHIDLADEACVRRASDFFSEEQVRVVSVHIPYKKRGPGGKYTALSPVSNDSDVFMETIEQTVFAACAAEMFGARIVVLHGGVYRDVLNGETVSNFVSFMASVAGVLKDSDVRVAVENVATQVSDSGFLPYLIEKAGAERFGICLDVAHANISDEPVAALKRCAGHLLHVHVSDNMGKRDDHMVPMEGNIDWEGVMRALSEIGYDGFINFEPRGDGGASALMEKCMSAYGKPGGLITGDKIGKEKD